MAPTESITDEPMVSLKGVTKRFPRSKRPALDGISAQIPRGLITGIVGPDGAGKTTLMRIMADLLDPSAGEVVIADMEPRSASRHTDNSSRDQTGYMPQKFGLYEDLSVRENLELHADLRAVTGEHRREVFERLLTFTDLVA